MKVKVGNEIYDASVEPIMIILEDKDKENIKNMLADCKKYCQYPDSYNEGEILKWMNEDE